MLRVQRYLGGIICAVLLSSTACDSPLVPAWELAIRTPVISDTFAVRDYLPEPLAFVNDMIVVPDMEFEQAVSLQDICPTCFSDIVEGSYGYPSIRFQAKIVPPFPENFVKAKFVSGQLNIDITHAFPYDLLRSSTGEYGVISVEIVDTAGVAAVRQVVSGEDVSFQGGDTLKITVPLSGVVINRNDCVYLTFVLPGEVRGGVEPFDPEGVFRVYGEISGVGLSQVTVLHEGFAVDQVFSGAVPEEARMRLQQPDMTLWVKWGVYHLFDLDGSVAMSFGTISGGDTTVVAKRSWSLNTGPFDEKLVLTPEDIHQLLEGDSVYVTLQGDIKPGPVTIRATDQIIVSIEVGANIDMNWSDNGEV